MRRRRSDRCSLHSPNVGVRPALRIIIGYWRGYCGCCLWYNRRVWIDRGVALLTWTAVLAANTRRLFSLPSRHPDVAISGLGHAFTRRRSNAAAFRNLSDNTRFDTDEPNDNFIIREYFCRCRTIRRQFSIIRVTGFWCVLRLRNLVAAAECMCRPFSGKDGHKDSSVGESRFRRDYVRIRQCCPVAGVQLICKLF